MLSPGKTYPGQECPVAEVGAFPGREIPRARVPFGTDSYSRVRIDYVYWNCIMISRLKCQLSGDVLHLCECDNTVYVVYPA